MTWKSFYEFMARGGCSVALDPFSETRPVLECCVKPVHATNQYKVDWTRISRESTEETWDAPNASKGAMAMAVPLIS